NFFLTIYWHRRFKSLRSGRTTPLSMVPHIDISQVPQIFVDDASSIDTDERSRPDFYLSSNDSHDPFVEHRNSGTGTLNLNPNADNVGESTSSSASTSYNVGSNLVFSDFNPFSQDESGLRQRSGRRT